MNGLTPELSDAIVKIVVSLIVTVLAPFIGTLLHAAKGFYLVGREKRLAELSKIQNEDLREVVLDAVLAVEQIAANHMKEFGAKFTGEAKYNLAIEFLEAKGFHNVNVSDIEAAVNQVKSEWNKPLAVE